ncbi:hypothetical protein DOTSEDRAFT_58361 [Dothistroma septosporum NZE10]|uniref:Uncharacterized protein n=1 Tax=Dothistroma septosporum (strain NZE10 / CBS 128990) TaxID=675120 RepID=N1Q5F0_DOTSN|nr:hypothetical protein DOTSEDRAFT_58361 [Dothistroma septosporum NZE10]
MTLITAIEATDGHLSYHHSFARSRGYAPNRSKVQSELGELIPYLSTITVAVSQKLGYAYAPGLFDASAYFVALSASAFQVLNNPPRPQDHMASLMYTRRIRDA